MLKFTAMQLVDDKDVKCMIFIVCQHAILSSIELYENIHLYRLPTPNPQPQYYPQSRYSHIFDATQDIFALTQPHKNLFEPNAFSFTQFLSFRVSDFGDVISILFHVLRCNDSLEM